MFKTHGLTVGGIKRHRLYRIWLCMGQRCNNPKNTHYKYYGGRGIKRCPEWNDYVIFHKWAMANGYREDYTIDRIDNDKGYYPENCRWGTVAQNNANKPSKRINDWGVYSKKKGYYAQICIDKINYYGGYSENIDEVRRLRDELLIKIKNKRHLITSETNLTDKPTRKQKTRDNLTGRFIWI